MPVSKVSAIVVTWNSLLLVEAAIESLRRQTHRLVEVVVVDNGSVDGTLEWLRRQPDLLVIENRSNRGFAAANNQGIARAVGEVVLLVNADVELEPEYVERCVAHFDDPTVGSVTGKLLRVRPPGQLDSTGHQVFAIGWTENRGEELADQGFDQPGEVFGVCAAAGLYRRKALDAVALGGQVLDEAYVSYIEDVDLDWRLRWNGWRAWYEPGAMARHHRHASGGPSSARVMRYILRNRLLTVIKNYDRASLLRNFPGLAAFTAVKTMDFARAHPSSALGLLDAVQLMPAALRQRRQIRERRLVGPAAVRPWLQRFPWRERLRRRIGRAV